MDARIESLKSALEAAEATAAELLRDGYHGRSPHAGPLRSRLVAARESLEWHGKWCEATPETTDQKTTDQKTKAGTA